MTYEQHMINLIKETGARNFIEASMINRLRECWIHRHRVTTTSIGVSGKFDLYWVKRITKKLRSYRKWLDWCEANNCEIPATIESLNEPQQTFLFEIG